MMGWILGVGMALAAPCTVVQGGVVHSPDGPLDDASVVLAEGRIVAVGPQPAGLEIAGEGARWQGRSCERLQVQGAHITAGLIEASSRIGLVEIGLEAFTVDDRPSSVDPVRAALRVVDAYNPRSALVPVARAGGISAAILHPAGGTVSGQIGAVQLLGDTQQQTILRRSVGVRASMRRDGSRAEGLLRLRELLAETRWYAEYGARWEANRAREPVVERLDLEAMLPVVRGELPLVVAADRAADLEALARLAQEEQLRVIIEGAAEGHLVAPILAEAGVSVVVDPLVYGPGSFDQLHASEHNAARLVAAGVPVAISTFSAHNARDLRVRAGNAVRGGLSHVEALRAITEVPADLFGLRERGRLEPGAAGSLVVWSGDPLEPLTRLVQAWIDGETVPAGSRQQVLRDRYLGAASPVGQLSKP